MYITAQMFKWTDNFQIFSQAAYTAFSKDPPAKIKFIYLCQNVKRNRVNYILMSKTVSYSIN